MKRVRGIVWTLATIGCLAGIYAAVQEPIVEPDLAGSGGAHADHTPRHGGIFFMAPDSYHHLEGTLALETREFRLYLYDNFTRPMDARRFQARVGSLDLTPTPNGEYLSGRLDEIPGTPPHITAFVRFAERREDRFDFVFVPELLR